MATRMRWWPPFSPSSPAAATSDDTVARVRPGKTRRAGRAVNGPTADGGTTNRGQSGSQRGERGLGQSGSNAPNPPRARVRCAGAPSARRSHAEGRAPARPNFTLLMTAAIRMRLLLAALGRRILPVSRCNRTRALGRCSLGNGAVVLPDESRVRVRSRESRRQCPEAWRPVRGSGHGVRRSAIGYHQRPRPFCRRSALHFDRSLAGLPPAHCGSP